MTLLVVLLLLIVGVFLGLIYASFKILSYDYDLDDTVKATRERMKKAPDQNG